jgi:hypothetical protein
MGLEKPPESMTRLDERHFMRLHIQTLFTHDAAGRMVRVNEPDGKPAPRVFIGRTAAGHEVHVRHDVDTNLAHELMSITAREPLGSELLEAPYGSPPYEAALGRVAGVERVWAGPAFRFPGQLPVAPSAVLVTDANASLLDRFLPEWLPDVAFRQPFFASVVDGHAVSACCSVRIGEISDEAGVETTAEYRRRGYAVEAVAAWASAVRARGRIPLYSTSWQNTASQAVARKLGLVRYGSDLHLT